MTTPDTNLTNGAPSDLAAEQLPARALVDARLVAGIVAIAAISAGMTFFLIRSTLRRVAPPDPTSERIQRLIDEANSLLRTLDDKKPR